MIDDEIFYLSHDINPAHCIFCGTDMIMPRGWKRTPVNGVHVIVFCANCRKEYLIVMDIDQATKWDLELDRQFKSIEVNIKALADSISE